MFKTITSSWIVSILSIFIIVFYNATNPIIKNELYSSILLTNKNELTFNLKGNTTPFINIPIKIENTIDHISTLHIEYIVQQHNIHTKINIGISVLILSILAGAILVYKLNSMLYKHEIYKIIVSITKILQLAVVTLIFFKENIRNILLKKNITLPEILFENDYIYNMTEVSIILVYVILYNFILTKSTNDENKNPMCTKIGIQIITLVLLTATAQYSIYEILMVLLYAETTYQYNNIRRLNGKRS